jgi:predicted transcriptional regulator
MRTVETLSVTLPPEMLAMAQEMARREHRTMSELVREALRQYERANFWNDMNAYGTAMAAKRGLSESDVVRLVKESRAETTT